MPGDYKRSLDWKGKHKAYKVYEKQGKYGPFLQGKFSEHFDIVVQKNTFNGAPDGEHIAYLIPAKWEKVGAEEAKNVTPERAAAELGGDDELPF